MQIKRQRAGFIACVGLMAFTAWSCDKPRQISFNRDIRPIINAKCITCHGGVKQSGEFSLLFEEEAKAPAKSGKLAIIPGDSKHSEMIRRLTHSDTTLRMPLDKPPLSKEEIELIADWIDQGAKWEKHWAYISPDTSIVPPRSAFDSIARNGIDHFIFRKLEEIGLNPSPEAEKELLLRRVYLDLTGLPPSKEDYDRFLADESPDAFEKVIDTLLESPSFGEKWASMWLDLARYADSKGYEKDLHRNIWKYRDWVIDAFNRDMPFNEFTVQQLAGDLLPHPSKSQLIATAFHRNSMANDEGGTNDEEFRVAAVLERVGTTFEVWQGTTMACAQCHSHTYDPIRHEDFYRAMAIFNNTADKDLYNEQPKLLTYEKEDKQKVTKLLNWLQARPDLADASAAATTAGPAAAPGVPPIVHNAAFSAAVDPAGDEAPAGAETPSVTGASVGDNPPAADERFLYREKESLMKGIGYRKTEAEEFQNKSSLIELVSYDQRSIWQVQDSSWIMFEDLDLTGVEAISFGYASLYGAMVEIHLDSPLGPKIGEAALEVTASGFPGNKPETWAVAKTPIAPVEGTRDVYYYFKKDKRFAQDLLRMDWIFYHEKQAAYKKAGRETLRKIEALEEIDPLHTPILRELSPEKSRETRVFNRGDWRNPEQEVKPGIPPSMGSIPGGKVNRLSFARWLVGGENPLTARVFVNRVWEQLFGFGIVETPGDFGSQGIPPTHPELLDWLAVQFRDKHQWHLKSFLKQVVMSAAYRQSSAVSEEALEKDPYNKYLSRGSRTRLPSEVIRDQALAVSGLLNPEMHGPGVMPYQPESVKAFGGTFWHESKGGDRYRRAVYTYWKRTNSYPSMVAFDSPSREVCTSRRIRTNTPLQALVLLNDPAYVEAAEAWARKIMDQYPDDVEKGIAESLQLITAVPPGKEKIAALTGLYRESLAYYTNDSSGRELLRGEKELGKNEQVANASGKSGPGGSDPEKPGPGKADPRLAALAVVTNVMFNLDEFVTRR